MPTEADAATTVSEGTCGTGVSYVLDSDGLLTISGSGAMSGYPWDAYDANIKKVVIGSGVTSISNDAFNGCINLTEITIPDTVKTINYRAFIGCKKLTEVAVPGSVTSIGSSAFADCTSLTEFTIPGGVKTIQSSTFRGCRWDR